MDLNEKKPFLICIEETLRRKIIVRADSEQEALRIADTLYIDQGEIVLDADDFCDNSVVCEGVADKFELAIYNEYKEV